MSITDASPPRSGEIALITGGAKRVGRAIALELARAGYDICIHYHHSRNEAKELQTQIGMCGRRCALVQANLNDSASWPRIIQTVVTELGGLDILVNNASTFLTSTDDTIEAFDPLLWEKMLRTNLLAPMALCHFAVPYLSAQGNGRIVNIGDAQIDTPGTHHLAYVASKGALATATRALARALAPTIRVNAVAPGIAVFPDAYSAALRSKLTADVPLQRSGTPEEVAKVVRFLVESATYITGQTVPIDGGRNLV